MASLSTTIAPFTASAGAATAAGATVQGTVLGGGGAGSLQSAGGAYNSSTLKTVTAAGCTVANGPDSTATGLCAGAGSISGLNGAVVTTSAPGASAYGAYAQAQAADTTAIGFRAIAAKAGDVALGYQAQATGDPATAIGANSLASGSNAVALGASATASGANSVALGAGSVAAEANTVSVGSVGAERRITNVAPGVNPTDAVNVAQLTTVQNFAYRTARYAYSGIAGATALSMIPPIEPGKHFSLGVGFGDYRGYGSFAIGATGRINEYLTVKGGVSITNNDPAFGVGAAVSW